MRFTFVVQCEVTRVQGKFVGRDVIAQELQDALEQADPGTLQPEDSEYQTNDWIIEEQAQPTKATVRK